MKIGILTHPLINNYGGILQNFALQQVLNQLGHNAITVDVDIQYDMPFLRILAGWCNRLRLHYINGERVPVAFNPKPSIKQFKRINHNTLTFVERHIIKTELVTNFTELSNIDKKYHFDAYVIGSDQVWNPGLCPWYFGSFIDRDDVKLVSYAASFGYDDWRLNQKLTISCADLAKKFMAVSVREDSAVGLCRKYLGVDAIHVIDPTLLLSREDYLKIIKTTEERRGLFSYILDNNEDKSKIVLLIASQKGLDVRTCMPDEIYLRGLSKIENCIFPTVDKWINGVNNADFVITDSYHGTVFAILFNVPFIAIGNQRRGLARFESLLRMFNLEDRLVSNMEEACAISKKPIDFTKVNEVLESERRKAFEFLKKLS